MRQAENDSQGVVKLGPATLYGTLKRLLEASLVEEVGGSLDTSHGEQRRRYYRITVQGQTVLAGEVDRFERLATIGRLLVPYAA